MTRNRYKKAEEQARIEAEKQARKAQAQVRMQERAEKFAVEQEKIRIEQLAKNKKRNEI